MADALAQRDHRRSPGRTGVALVVPLEIDFMACCEGGAHSAAIFCFVKSYLSFPAFSLCECGQCEGLTPRRASDFLGA